MDFLCFNTTDPAAFNATMLYDYNNDDDNLWVRQTELPPCSFTLSPSEFLCLVCHQIIIYAVCSNLPNGVKIVMEGVGVQIETLKSECPKPVTYDDHTGQLSVAIITAICLITFIIIIIIGGLVFFLRRRRHKAQQQQRTRERQTNQVQNGGDHMSRLTGECEASVADFTMIP